jgi:hypothetical protein
MAKYLEMPGVDMTVSNATKHGVVTKMLLAQHWAKMCRQQDVAKGKTVLPRMLFGPVLWAL